MRTPVDKEQVIFVLYGEMRIGNYSIGYLFECKWSVTVTRHNFP